MRRAGRLWWRACGRALALALLGTAAGCSALMPRSPAMFCVPPENRDGNPFGPEANEARERGEARPCLRPRLADRWLAFAHDNIQTGDLLFRRGRSCFLHGRMLGRALATLNDGRWSHVALACWEGDHLWVYDAELEGVRKIPFELWMVEVSGSAFAVKRLKPEYRSHIPQAIAWADGAYHRCTPFDFDFRPGPEKLYCTKMVELSFRSSGLKLSEPVQISQLPGFSYFAVFRPAVEMFSDIDCDAEVFALGNEGYGTYGSPLLELVYEGPEGGTEVP